MNEEVDPALRKRWETIPADRLPAEERIAFYRDRTIAHGNWQAPYYTDRNNWKELPSEERCKEMARNDVFGNLITPLGWLLEERRYSENQVGEILQVINEEMDKFGLPGFNMDDVIGPPEDQSPKNTGLLGQLKKLIGKK